MGASVDDHDVDLGARPGILATKTHRDSIPIRDLIRMLEKSKPTRVTGTAVFLTSDPEVAPSALMHNLKHNKVLHERVFICQREDRRDAARSPTEPLRNRDSCRTNSCESR